MSKQVTLNFDIDDVYGLWHTSTRSFYFDQIDRFETIKDLPATFEKDKGLYMYWLDGYAGVLLFIKILDAFGYSTAVLDDMASEEVNQYVVLTDFSGGWEVIK
tara:strand:- start:154 stop:462 length:309 start_codon:yes stop_codon:yes gene_type:complete